MPHNLQDPLSCSMVVYVWNPAESDGGCHRSTAASVVHMWVSCLVHLCTAWNFRLFDTYTFIHIHINSIFAQICRIHLSQNPGGPILVPWGRSCNDCTSLRGSMAMLPKEIGKLDSLNCHFLHFEKQIKWCSFTYNNILFLWRENVHFCKIVCSGQLVDSSAFISFLIPNKWQLIALIYVLRLNSDI